MSLIEQAANLARCAHKRQKYYLGHRALPYFEAHVEPVAEIVRKLGYGALTISSALLHDVVEDTPVTLQNLRDEGFPEVVVETVDATTERPGEAPSEFMARTLVVPRAVVVRFADSSYNFGTTISQLDLMPADRFRSRVQKHGGRVAQLQPHLPSPGELPD